MYRPVAPPLASYPVASDSRLEGRAVLSRNTNAIARMCIGYYHRWFSAPLFEGLLVGSPECVGRSIVTCRKKLSGPGLNTSNRRPAISHRNDLTA